MPRKNENEPYTRITSEEANKILENKEGVVIDVRGEDEYIKVHVKGATLIPVDQITTRVNELPENEAFSHSVDLTLDYYLRWIEDWLKVIQKNPDQFLLFS